MITRVRTLGYGALGLLPWAVWYAALECYRSMVRVRKDPSLYRGTCEKPNGYVVPCTLDQWLEWDATPLIDGFTFLGAIVAAFLSGLVLLKYLQLR